MSGKVRVRRVAELLRPYRLRAVAAAAAIALATLATLAPPYLAGRAIDDVINGGARSSSTRSCFSWSARSCWAGSRSTPRRT